MTSLNEDPPQKKIGLDPGPAPGPNSTCQKDPGLPGRISVLLVVVLVLLVLRLEYDNSSIGTSSCTQVQLL